MRRHAVDAGPQEQARARPERERRVPPLDVLRRARELYDREGAGKLGAAALGHALTDALGLLPEDDEERAAAAKLSANGAAAQEVQRLLHEKPFLRGADGRYDIASRRGIVPIDRYSLVGPRRRDAIHPFFSAQFGVVQLMLNHLCGDA